MNQSSSLLFFLMVAIILGCNKTNLPTNLESIEEMTAHIPVNDAHNAQLRLAIGQALSRALNDEQVRDFIYKKLQTIKNYNNNEILLVDILNENLMDGRRFGTVLQSNMEENTRDLFDFNLDEKIFVEDPMVAIYLPSMFTHLLTEIKNEPCVVYVDMQYGLVDNEFFNQNILFHHSGFQDKMGYHFMPKYFGITLRNAIKSILISNNSTQIWDGGSILDRFPQLVGRWKDFSIHFGNEIREHPSIDDYNIIRTATIDSFYYNYVRQNCNKVDTSMCPNPCIRDCFKPAEICDKIDKLMIKNEYRGIKFIDPSMIFRDHMSVLISIFEGRNDPGTLIQNYIAHNLNPFDVMTFDNSWTVNYRTICYDVIGQIELPILDGDFIWKDNTKKSFSIDVPIEKDWDPNNEPSLRGFSVSMIQFSNQNKNFRYNFDPANPYALIDVWASSLLQISTLHNNYCDQPNASFDLGEFNLSFSF